MAAEIPDIVAALVNTARHFANRTGKKARGRTPKRRSSARCCRKCGEWTFLWNHVFQQAQCNGCNNKTLQAKAEYDRDAESRMLVKRACQICGSTEKLVYHHLHTISPATVHAVLCNDHNTLLGRFKDDPAAIHAFADKVAALAGQDCGVNKYDPQLDGALYVPQHKKRCVHCDVVLINWGKHIQTPKHQLALAAQDSAAAEDSKSDG